MHLVRTLSLVALVATTADAQAYGASVNPHFATRVTLEARAASAESAYAAATNASSREAKRAEAWVLRERLKAGDFHPGDRIAVVIDGHPTMSDTFAVRTGKTLAIPNLPEIPLVGVLRAELHAHLTREIARFVRDPVLRATPLMRVAVLGRVARPGYYRLPADALLSDAIMGAGGPAPDANLERSTIRRGTERLLTDRDVTMALGNGMTLDQLDLRAGDEIVVGKRNTLSVQTALQTVGVLVGLFAAARAFRL